MFDSPQWQQCRHCPYREFAAEVPALGLRRDRDYGLLCHRCSAEVTEIRGVATFWPQPTDPYDTPIPWLREPG